MKYYPEKICEVCGRLYTPRSGRAKTCSVHCSRKLNAINRALNYEYDPELKRAKTEREKKEEKKMPKKDQLSIDAHEAHKKNISYGRYMAYVKDKGKKDAKWDLEFNALKRRIAKSYEEVTEDDTASSNLKVHR